MVLKVYLQPAMPNSLTLLASSQIVFFGSNKQRSAVKVFISSKRTVILFLIQNTHPELVLTF